MVLIDNQNKLVKKIIVSLSFCLSSLCGFAQTVTISQNLNVPGKIQINGNSGTTGQVLMSNGSSAPAWTSVSNSTCAVGGKFLMTTENQTNSIGDFDNSLNAPVSQVVTVTYSGIIYNTNADVSIVASTGIITCNRTGLYHFEGMLRYFVTSSQTQIPRGNIGYFASFNFLLDEVTMGQTVPAGANNSYAISIPFSLNRYLTAGQTIKFLARLFNLDTNPAIVSMGISSGSSISGHFVSE